MRKIIKSITGKEISEDISLIYLIQRGVPVVLGLLRGYLKKIGMSKVGKKFFVGKHVTLLDKKKMNFGANVRIEDGCRIDAFSKEGIQFGDDVKIGANSIIIGSGSISSPGKGLTIGNDTYFSEYTFFGSAGGIKIGSHVISGQQVRFHAENHLYSNRDKLIKDQGVTHLGITVGDDCWIGAGSVFLDGSSIGNGCIVAANAVVTKSFPDNVIIGGVPARVLSER